MARKNFPKREHMLKNTVRNLPMKKMQVGVEDIPKIKINLTSEISTSVGVGLIGLSGLLALGGFLLQVQSPPEPSAEAFSVPSVSLVHQTFVQKANDWSEIQSGDQSAELNELVLATQVRERRMENLIRTNPSAFLDFAIDAAERDSLPPSVQEHIEVQKTLEGVLSHTEAENFDTQASEEWYALAPTDQAVSNELIVSFVKPPAETLVGSSVRIEGWQLGDTVAATSEPLTIQAPSQPLQALATPQTLKVAAVKINFQDDTSAPDMDAQIRDTLFTGINSIKGLYEESSYGQLSFGPLHSSDGSADIFGWVTVPYTKTNCVYSSWGQSARSQLGAALNGYDKVIFVLPETSACWWQGIAGGANAYINGTTLFIPRFVGHELGHTIGMMHSNFYDCQNDEVEHGTCVSDEYEDHYSIMSNRPHLVHPNAPEKIQMGWLDASTILNATTDGTYTIGAIEQSSSTPKAILIPRTWVNGSPASWYVLESRLPVSYDSREINIQFVPSNQQNGVFNGVMVHVAGNVGSLPAELQPNNWTQLLDMTPGSCTPDCDQLDPTLRVGQTYTDAITGVSMTTVSQDSTTVTVSVHLPAPITASVTSPLNTASISGITPITAAATDGVGVAGVQFKLNGVNVGSEDVSSPFSLNWDTRTVANGSYAITAVARNAAGSSITSTSVVVTVNNPDITPPTVTLTNPVNNATVSGNVAIAATASDNVGVVGVQFQLDGTNLGSEDTSSPYSLSWDSQTVVNGAHALRAAARDAGGNTAMSTVVNITVNNAIADTTPPTVSLTSPTNGATLLGNVSLTATASDNVGVIGVQFKLDGVNIGSEDTTTPYSITWDSTSTTNASHMVTASARDAAGNTTTSSPVTVTVNNGVPDTTPPTITQTSPLNGATVSGNLSLTATASDNIGVVGVQFKVDGANVGSEDTTAPYAITWSSASATNTSHTLTASARDAAGNSTLSAAVSVVVNNPVSDTTPPTVSLTSPANGVTVSGNTNVTATAADNVGVVGVQFKLDGSFLGAEDTTSPYSIAWNTLTAVSGAHMLTATARDAAGNSTTSSPVAATVNNSVVDVSPPTVSITAPSANTVIVDTVTLVAVASDNIGVLGVQFWADDVMVQSEDLSSPYAVTWNTKSVSNGVHTITAVARDVAGHSTTSAGIMVTVNNTILIQPPVPTPITPLTITLISPTGQPKVSGQTKITATVSGQNIVRVEFFYDQTFIGLQPGAPFEVIWDTTRVGDGLHTVWARVFAENLSVLSSAVVVIVENNPAVGGGIFTLTVPNKSGLVSGRSIPIDVDATGYQLSSVSLYVGTRRVGVDSTYPYRVNWDSRSVPNGAYVVRAVAKLQNGQQISAIHRIRTSNRLEITIRPPQNGIVNKTFAIKPTVLGGAGIKKIEYTRLPWTKIGKRIKFPFSLPWNTRSTRNGSYTIRIKVTDMANKTATTNLKVIVRN